MRRRLTPSPPTHDRPPRTLRTLRGGARIGALFTGLAIVAGACSSGGGGEPGRSGDQPGPTEEASAFVLTEVPGGLELTYAGEGEERQEWGKDSGGTDEATTVLAPEGEQPTAANVVTVWLTGFAQQQGGLAQSSPSYIKPDGGSEVSVAGGPAYLTPRVPVPVPRRPAEELDVPPWTDLVAQTGEDLAVRVTSPVDELSPEQLAGVVRATRRSEPVRTGTGRQFPTHPSVEDPPGGYEVVGWVDADGLVATYSNDSLPRFPSHLSGTYAASWGTGDDLLSITTLPGQHLTPGAAVALSREAFAGSGPTEPATVDGRPAVWLTSIDRKAPGPPAPPEEPQPGTVRRTTRTLITTTSWGDAVVITSVDEGRTALGRDRLAGVVTDLRQADPDDWPLVREATAELDADPGYMELRRGTTPEGTRWLLQAEGGQYSIKLGDGSRLEPGSAGGSANAFSESFDPATDAEGYDLPPIKVVAVIDSPAGARVQVERPDCSTEVASFETAEGLRSPGLGQPASVAVVVGPTAEAEDACPPPSADAPSCGTGTTLVDGERRRLECLP